MRLIAPLTGLFATASLAATSAESPDGWRLEQGVDPPSYAVAVPRSANVNVDAVVLACEPAGTDRVLQLQIYLTDDGPLLPKGTDPRSLKEQARAEIVIDRRIFATGIFFADDHVVLGDSAVGAFPALSKGLVDALAEGQTMVLRFDLVVEKRGRPAAFDGEVVLDLQAGLGGSAVMAVRRCATPAGQPPSVVRLPSHLTSES